MADSKLIALTVMLLSFACFLELVVSDDVTVNQLSGINNDSCVTKEADGSFSRAVNCTNGRGLSGCCVDRPRCDYSTSNIDLTLYAPHGVKKTCPTTLICCPVQYVLPMPILEHNVTSKVDNLVEEDDFFDSDI